MEDAGGRSHPVLGRDLKFSIMLQMRSSGLPLKENSDTRFYRRITIDLAKSIRIRDGITW
jgi:hypothetical protein